MSARSSARRLLSPIEDPEKLISRRNRSEPSLLFDLEEDDMAGQAPPQGPIPDLRSMEELVDNTLFTKKRNSHIIIVQIYVDDIIFGSTCQELCDDFLKIMHDEFEMSMMGELNFFPWSTNQTTRR
ncbi:retrovirus-related pol polyprotein from transposon TNT 1-94 [Tanacetum coccineum]